MLAGNAAKISSRISASGAIAQLGERVVRNDEAVGSIPTSSTNNSITYIHPVVPFCPKLVQNFSRMAAGICLNSISALERNYAVAGPSCEKAATEEQHGTRYEGQNTILNTSTEAACRAVARLSVK